MALTDPVLTGPQDGRTVTYGDGSSAELKVEGEQTGGQWAVVEWHVRAGDEPPIHTHTREDEDADHGCGGGKQRHHQRIRRPGESAHCKLVGDVGDDGRRDADADPCGERYRVGERR